MARYDDLFGELAADDSVFADESVLDPLAELAEIVPRTAQERAVATILTGAVLIANIDHCNRIVGIYVIDWSEF